jgi:pSer/pThr/pTyr-binding forkhead associated (FHA) protein
MATQKSSFIERLIQKILTGFGGLIDGIFGGGKKNRHPSTRDLIEKLKVLIDENLREDKKIGLIAPHSYKVRFEAADLTATDSMFYNLRNELLAAAITYINDNRYKTLAAPQVDIKADMFTTGIRLSVDFGESTFEVNEAQIKRRETKLDFKIPEQLLQPKIAPPTDEIEVRALIKLPLSVREVRFNLLKGKRINVGRGKDNELFLDDGSVSKIHASLVFRADRGLLVADTGSSNGTFLKGERLAYGKAFEVAPGETVKFGEIEVTLAWEVPQIVAETPIVVEQTAPDAAQIMTDGEFQFKIKSRETRDFSAQELAVPTAPASANPPVVPAQLPLEATQTSEKQGEIGKQSFETHFGKPSENDEQTVPVNKTEQQNSAEKLFGKAIGSEEKQSFETRFNQPPPIINNAEIPKQSATFAPPPPKQDFGIPSPPKIADVPAPLPSANDTAQFGEEDFTHIKSRQAIENDELTSIKPRPNLHETQDFVPAPIPKE